MFDDQDIHSLHVECLHLTSHVNSKMAYTQVKASKGNITLAYFGFRMRGEEVFR